MEKPPITSEASRESKEEYKKRRTDELRKYILDTHVKPEEYYKKGQEALKTSWDAQTQGVYLKGEFIGYERRHKASVALGQLSDDVLKRVTAHGIASNVPGDLPEEIRKNFPLVALLQILATGEIKGDWTNLKNESNSSVFTDAPFILLSNKDENLGEVDQKTGKAKLKSLRTVLVNGQYESMTDDLKKRFPGVSFHTADQIDNDVFDKKSEQFKSFEDTIQEKIDSETKE